MNLPSSSTALVVGAGGTGLSCAAELQSRGVSVLVLERGPAAATAWADRYTALRLNTGRRISELPETPFPTEWGMFPTGTQVTSYLRRYAEDRHLDVRTGCDVERIDPCPEGWAVRTGRGSVRAGHVVVATGMYHTPVLPTWPSVEEFPGRVLHSADYRDARGFEGADVLVVGAATSALEIAHDLVVGGAARVRMAVRTPPNLMLRSLAGRPASDGLPLLLRLPVPVADALAAVMRRVTIGDLTRHGLPAPKVGPFRELAARKAAASVDKPTLEDLRAGRITVVPTVVDVGPDGAVLADGSALDVDAVVAATGFGAGLEGLVGHLDVLDDEGIPRRGDGTESRPGLRFVGYEFVPGVIALAARRAVELATEISRREAARSGAPTAPSTSP